MVELGEGRELMGLSGSGEPGKVKSCEMQIKNISKRKNEILSNSNKTNKQSSWMIIPEAW